MSRRAWDMLAKARANYVDRILVEASDTLRPGPGPYRGVVYYDPEGDPTPPSLRPRPKYPAGPRPSTTVHGKCQCGSGSDDLGPGHSSWCPRHVQ